MVREFQLLSTYHSWWGTCLVFPWPHQIHIIARVLLGLNANPFSFPQFIILFSANWIFSEFILMSMSEAMIIMSSAYPTALTVPDWNSLSKESITKFHTRGERIPPWGLPLPGVIVCATPRRLAVTFLPSNRLVYHSEGTSPEFFRLVPAILFCLATKDLDSHPVSLA